MCIFVFVRAGVSAGRVAFEGPRWKLALPLVQAPAYIPCSPRRLWVTPPPPPPPGEGTDLAAGRADDSDGLVEGRLADLRRATAAGIPDDSDDSDNSDNSDESKASIITVAIGLLG